MNGKPGRAARLVSVWLCAALALSALAGCGAASRAQLTEGQKLMKDYLSGLGRGAALADSHVDVLRPAADKLVASDYVKGSFRAGGETYEFAVNTVTGAVYTSERLAELKERIVAHITARLGLDPGVCVADCLMELWRPAWQEENAEWPWERAYLGEVIPVDVTDMDAYVDEALADQDVRILLYLACRSGELWEGRWSDDELADWDAVEVELFGFADDEPLPSLEIFPSDYHYETDRPRMTLTPTEVRYTPGIKEGS